MYTYIHTYIYTYKHAYIRTSIHTCIHIHKYVYSYVQSCVRTCRHTWCCSAGSRSWTWRRHLSAATCSVTHQESLLKFSSLTRTLTHTCRHMQTHTQSGAYVCVFVCACVCACVCVCVLMCVCACVRICHGERSRKRASHRERQQRRKLACAGMTWWYGAVSYGGNNRVWRWRAGISRVTCRSSTVASKHTLNAHSFLAPLAK